MDVKIIGGVAAGMSAAAKLKRLLKDEVEITVYEKGDDLSYGACGMPYFISDVIKDEASLIARDKAAFEEAGIHVQVFHEVLEINEKTKTLRIKDIKQEKIFETSYDKLIIASGARAIRLKVEGHQHAHIHTLTTLDAARDLKRKLKEKSVQSVGVIGASFIGLEVVEALKELGKTVHLIERETRVMPKYDQAITDEIETHLKAHGINLHLGETLESYQANKTQLSIQTNKGSYDVDLVIEAIGVLPNTGFCGAAFKKLKNGALIVDETLKTSVEDVYAAGDCVAYPHRLKNFEPAFVPLGTHANKAGRIIAHRLAGFNDTFAGILGSNQLKVLDLEVAMSGLSLQEANDAGYQAATQTIQAKNQAGYYPGAKTMVIKITYDQDTCQLLGAQMVGEKGVALRINTMAVALSQKLTAQEFSQLDLAYAPPFAPVWDPMQVATNQIKCPKKG